VHRYVALSRDLERYLVDRVGIPEMRVTRISNGVDIHRFYPLERRGAVPAGPFNQDGLFVFGSVGRMAEVKDPLLLARAFVALRQRETSASRARLVMVGDGPLRAVVREEIVKAGLEADVWMPGSRDDVPALLRGLDCFVLPSLAEGISNTILEAMATGLPVIATSVGGNGELVQDGVTGRLVPAANVEALVAAMKSMICDPAAARSSGVAGRARAVAQFGIESMVRRYSLLYDEMLLTPGARTRPAVSPQRAGGE
jgi:sugar transferase (PEP-CTERM/EpsH1 system associated)